ncbi:hypothetical protein BD779DRAFT_1797407 [Infundibulicybe gibba]|nr:hypothetical protein BD779DRAFT_1797407 [Infundibulicybe gibba]
MALCTFGALTLLTVLNTAHAYWLMGIPNILTVQRLDPIVNPGGISTHLHQVVGGSNFGRNVDTDLLRKSECTSTPIAEDKSNYWTPTTHFLWANGSTSLVAGGFVMYYLFDDKPGSTTAFPDNFRMISGDAKKRQSQPGPQQDAVSYLCLDFQGQTTRHETFPEKSCPSGIRKQINFQSCWDGKNVDSPNHQDHVAYRSEGPDRGTCKDPKYPITIPSIFIEFYLDTVPFEKYRSQAKNPKQPFVLSNGETNGYSFHADFFNGWDSGVLQKAIDGCNCNPFGDPTCCHDKGIFTVTKDKKCFITPSVDEQVTGTLAKLPGSNPIQEGPVALVVPEAVKPGFLSPIYVYTDKPTATGTLISPPATNTGVSAPSSAAPEGTTTTQSSQHTPSPKSMAPEDNTAASPLSSSTPVVAPASANPIVDPICDTTDPTCIRGSVSLIIDHIHIRGGFIVSPIDSNTTSRTHGKKQGQTKPARDRQCEA